MLGRPGANLGKVRGEHTFQGRLQIFDTTVTNIPLVIARCDEVGSLLCYTCQIKYHQIESYQMQ
jgi:hypothetical protein